ncbi:MAG: hypothetical protein KC877_00685 [Candidatus Kaiserbacteria bacterium]|nr:hypothetical protein [Candidatus Kaiserbacteria bacterium]MCB9815947.1 hypothetical protein [Candidatus Nomurabacteria bacterium]
MFPAVISFAAVLGAAVITADDVSYVRLESSSATVEAGQPFSIAVYAYAHVPVNAVDIKLKFDGNAVEVTGVDTGQSVITIWTEEPVIEKNSVTLRGGTYRKGFVSEHLIATINLRSLQTGQKSFSVSDVVLLAGDGAGTPVSIGQTTDSSVSLFVYDENTSPESIGVNVEVRILTDIDGNGKVDLRDISAFMSAWHDKKVLYDFNGDGRMTFRDFSIILADFFFK